MGLRIEDLADPNSVKPPRRGATVFTSRQVRGLQYVVKANGRREFHYRYARPAGGRTTIKIGDAPMMSATDAIREAAAHREAVRRGVDVVHERRQAAAQVARAAAASAALVEPRWRFSTLAADYMTAQESLLRPSSARRIRGILRTHLAGPVAGWDVRVWPLAEYDALILSLTAKSAATASIVHRTARGIFGWAVEQGRLPLNPVAGRRSLTRKLKVAPRTEVLTGAQLHQLLSGGPALYGDVWPILHAQLLTGLRIGEVTALRPEWIDMRGRVAKLPASVMKTKAAAEVVLSDAARRLIVDARKARPDSPTVFGTNTQDTLNALRRVGGPVVRTHTIRRTVATTLQQLGIGEEVRRAILNHAAALGIGKHYDHSKIRAAQLAALTKLAAHWEAVKVDATAHNADEIVTAADDELAAEFEALR